MRSWGKRVETTQKCMTVEELFLFMQLIHCHKTSCYIHLPFCIVYRDAKKPASSLQAIGMYRQDNCAILEISWLRLTAL